MHNILLFSLRARSYYVVHHDVPLMHTTTSLLVVLIRARMHSTFFTLTTRSLLIRHSYELVL